MIFCKNNLTRLTIGLAILLLTAACKGNDEFVVPAFLHVDAIKVASQQGRPAGHNTSKIGTAYVVAYYPGRSAVDTVGVFELPFTVPVLFNGDAEYIEIYPAVQMSGVSALRPYYPFYETIVLNDGTVLPSGDTLRLHFGAGDTLRFDTLTTSYTQLATTLLEEYFEPTQSSILFDSVVQWISRDAEAACSGQGCGKVHVNAGQSHVDFSMTERPPEVEDATVALFMELDYRSTKRLSVEMKSAETRGANETTKEIVTLNPTDSWKKIYINLRTTWKQFSYNPSFLIVFSALNAEGTEGDVWLDNIKILSTPY
ncbi:MAG: hypothetical protein K5650_02700 [Bacteroidales bacterium]|nr:hypothetical protein [Bacteroidales bacterium]